jgi:hypothetical protein
MNSIVDASMRYPCVCARVCVCACVRLYVCTSRQRGHSPIPAHLARPHVRAHTYAHTTHANMRARAHTHTHEYRWQRTLVAQ